MNWGEIALLNAAGNEGITLTPEDRQLADALAKTRGKNKFNAIRTQAHGQVFASKKEAARYGDLRLLELQHHISELETQPRFELAGGVKYVADFRYIEDGKVIVEDVKGGKATATAVFKVKWKQVQAAYPTIEFRLIA